MKTLILLVAALVAGQAAGADLRYGEQDARIEALAFQLRMHAHDCMYSIAVQQLTAGARNREQIEAAQVRMCGGMIVKVFGATPQSTALLRVIARQELANVPGVTP